MSDDGGESTPPTASKNEASNMLLLALRDKKRKKHANPTPNLVKKVAGVPLTCPKCGHKWLYTGQRRYPKCACCHGMVKNASVRCQSEKKEALILAMAAAGDGFARMACDIRGLKWDADLPPAKKPKPLAGDEEYEKEEHNLSKGKL